MAVMKKPGTRAHGPLEDHLIDTARTDADRALTLCADETVSQDELRMALRFSVAQLGLVADIAQARLDRREGE